MDSTWERRTRCHLTSRIGPEPRALSLSKTGWIERLTAALLDQPDRLTHHVSSRYERLPLPARSKPHRGKAPATVYACNPVSLHANAPWHTPAIRGAGMPRRARSVRFRYRLHLLIVLIAGAGGSTIRIAATVTGTAVRLAIFPVDVETTTPLLSVVCDVVSLSVPLPLVLWTLRSGPPPCVVVCASVGLAKIMVKRTIERKHFIFEYSICLSHMGDLSAHNAKSALKLARFNEANAWPPPPPATHAKERLPASRRCCEGSVLRAVRCSHPQRRQQTDHIRVSRHENAAAPASLAGRCTKRRSRRGISPHLGDYDADGAGAISGEQSASRSIRAAGGLSPKVGFGTAVTIGIEPPWHRVPSGRAT